MIKEHCNKLNNDYNIQSTYEEVIVVDQFRDMTPYKTLIIQLNILLL